MSMRIHHLQPGSPDWLLHRFGVNNASDAPVMLSCSPHLTRTELLDAITLGWREEVHAKLQEVYDRGHRFEHMAIALAERIIGQDLYPLVGTLAVEGFKRPLGASFDGLTMAWDTGWEHKTLNDELRDALPEKGPDNITLNNALNLPKRYRVQMEQQLMVAVNKKGVECRRVLFSATLWDEASGLLLEERHCWYVSDAALRAEILAGWRQFEADLERHTVVVHQETPKGIRGADLHLPNVVVHGAVVTSDLAAWRAKADSWLAGINTELRTDADFGQADADAKLCRDTAKQVADLKVRILQQMADVNEVVTTLDTIAQTINKKAIDLENRVKERKVAIRAEVIQRVEGELGAHVRTLQQRLGAKGRYLPGMNHPLIEVNFQEAVKGLKTVASLNNKANGECARAKIAFSAVADRVELNLQHLKEHCAEHLHLFPDEAVLVLKAPEDFQAVCSQRVTQAKEAEAKKRADEEAARQRREAEERERQERTQQLVGEHGGVMNGQAPVGAAPPVNTIVHLPDSVVAIERQLAQPGPGGHAVEADPFAPKAGEPGPLPLGRVEVVVPEGPPTLALGTISERLGFVVSSAFLSELGFDGTRERNAIKFHEAQFPAICQAIETHVRSVRALFTQSINRPQGAIA